MSQTCAGDRNHLKHRRANMETTTSLLHPPCHEAYNSRDASKFLLPIQPHPGPSQGRQKCVLTYRELPLARRTDQDPSTRLCYVSIHDSQHIITYVCTYIHEYLHTDTYIPLHTYHCIHTSTYIPVHTFHCISLRYITVQYSTVQYIILHYITLLQYITLHYSTV